MNIDFLMKESSNSFPVSSLNSQAMLTRIKTASLFEEKKSFVKPLRLALSLCLVGAAIIIPTAIYSQTWATVSISTDGSNSYPTEDFGVWSLSFSYKRNWLFKKEIVVTFSNNYSYIEDTDTREINGVSILDYNPAQKITLSLKRCLYNTDNVLESETTLMNVEGTVQSLLLTDDYNANKNTDNTCYRDEINTSDFASFLSSGRLSYTLSLTTEDNSPIQVYYDYLGMGKEYYEENNLNQKEAYSQSGVNNTIDCSYFVFGSIISLK